MHWSVTAFMNTLQTLWVLFHVNKTAFIYCEWSVCFQKEIRQWLERVSAEQDVPVLWDEEKTPSECCLKLLLLLHMSRFKWRHHNRCGGTLQSLPIKMLHDSWFRPTHRNENVSLRPLWVHQLFHWPAVLVSLLCFVLLLPWSYMLADKSALH